MKKKGLPKINELVLVTVNRVTPFAAWCSLEEYESVDGMIHISEVAGKWVYDIRNFVKEGKHYVARVLRIDRENQVNLSLKRVSSAEKREKMNEFRRMQRAERILEKVGEELNKNIGEVYEKVGIPLEEKFGDLFFAFESVHKSPEKLEELCISGEWAEALKKILEKTFKEKKITIKAEVDVKSYAPDGVERIKELLVSLQKDTGTRISCLSAPKYLLKMTTKEGKLKEKEIVEKLERMVKDMKKYGCEGSYKLLR